MKYFISWVAFFFAVTICFPLCWHLTSRLFEKGNQPDDSHKIGVYFVDEDTVKNIDAETYILGVLMAEMPAEFEIEALKAQSVAARTYLYEKIYSGSFQKEHKGADVCTNPGHCQAYISEKAAKEKWGKNASYYFKKCKNAVESTKGVVAYYNNKPIKAVFHAYASGKTEDAQDVWGGEVAYLKSVESPGDLSAPEFASVKTISKEEFCNTMSGDFGCKFNGKIIGEVSYTQGGSVYRIEVGDKVIKGTELRSALGLKSSCVKIKTEDNNLIFEVKGYGHGVGMSQYGANFCAKEGMSYDEILKKYYSGIELKNIHKTIE